MPEGHTIHRLAAEHNRTFAGRPLRVSSPQGRFAAGAARLDGRVLEEVQAHGKHLFYRFTEEQWLHVHLGLYGGFAGGPLPAPPPRGALRLRLCTTDAWTDLRGPTACELLAPGERGAILARLGPDPLQPDADPAPARARVLGSRAPLGVLLMDQSVIAGIGNVYRAEALFLAGIDPHRPGRALDAAAFDVLWSDLRRLLRAGVRAGRIVTTRPADRDRPRGRPTRADSFYVYRRAGLPCRVCGRPVRTEPMAGRNLFWCPGCQPS